jgi:hypothetical protein
MEDLIERESDPAKVDLRADDHHLARILAFQELAQSQRFSVSIPPLKFRPLDVNARQIYFYKKVSLVRLSSLAQFDQFMEAFQVKSGHLADFEAPNTDYEPRCDPGSIEFEPILLPFHSTCHHKDQIDGFYRIVPREALIEPVQTGMPPRDVLFGVAFGH